MNVTVKCLNVALLDHTTLHPIHKSIGLYYCLQTHSVHVRDSRSQAGPSEVSAHPHLTRICSYTHLRVLVLQSLQHTHKLSLPLVAWNPTAQEFYSDHPCFFSNPVSDYVLIDFVCYDLYVDDCLIPKLVVYDIIRLGR